MKNSDKKMTSKQIVAIIGIILLVLLYLVTLILAFIDTTATNTLFPICLISTIVIPVLIWIYTWLYGKLTGKSTIADLNIGGKDRVTDAQVMDAMLNSPSTGDGDN